MFSSRQQLLESLCLFDRPERERLRNFLPRDADVEALVGELFAPVEAGGGSLGGRRAPAAPG